MSQELNRGAQSTITTETAGAPIRTNAPAFNVARAPQSASPNAGRPNLLGFTGICVQLALVLLTMFLYEIEGMRGMTLLLPLIFGGFIVNALLPLKYRMGFFCLLSIASVGVILGPVDSLRLLAIGLALIGICHLPLPLLARVIILAGVGGVLAAIHAGRIETGWGPAVLPILAAMFMFRLAIYLYDIRNEKQPVGITARLSYFFMLPNVCFPLFPVVDYRAFLRSHYQKDALDTYQVGVQWMLRGVVHLLLYRLIYHNFVYTPETVENLSEVVFYMLTTYLLYLRISGLFHLIVGILCLFGFSLPETHHLYYLASSFNDYWRRINIYWKDFMMKLFYYPVLMRVKHLGTLASMSIATVAVFFATWILHAYQWFWLRGTFHISTVDSLFWAILGSLVVVNSIYQAKFPKKASLGKPRWSWSKASIHAMKVVAMFSFITALWAFWSGSSVAEYASVLRVAAGGSAAEFGGLFAVLLLAVFIGVGFQYVTHRGWSLFKGKEKPLLLRPQFVTAGLAILLMGFSRPEVDDLVGADAGQFIMTARTEQLNQRDQEILQRGYYEGLLASGRWGSQVWERQVQKPQSWEPFRETDGVVSRDDITQFAMKPSYEFTHANVTINTNQWGMRDREYTKEKPEGVYRIALLGASYEMGFGVEQDKVYEAVAEERLNKALADAGDERKVEILNFSVSGYTLVHWFVDVQERIWEFDPDAVIVTTRTIDKTRSTNFFAEVVKDGVPLPPELQDIATRAELAPDLSTTELERRLNRRRLGGDPFSVELYRLTYNEIAKACADHGATGIWLYVPRSQDIAHRMSPKRLLQNSREGEWGKAEQQALSEEAGLIPMDLDGAYGDANFSDLQIAPWDEHPNAEGHRMLGERLAAEILAKRDLLGL